LNDNQIKNAREDPLYQLYIVLSQGANITLYTIPGRVVSEMARSETKWRLGLGKWIKDYQREI